MTWFEKVRRRLRILFRKDDVEVELAEEVRLIAGESILRFLDGVL